MSSRETSTQEDQKIELLEKTVIFYRQSIQNYQDFARTERKPRTKRQLEQRLKVILQEIEGLRVRPVA